MTGARIGIVLLVAAVLAGGAAALNGRRRVTTSLTATEAELRAPAGVRIRVQVMNPTRQRGLARRVTTLLRDRGFDVVENGTGRGPARDSTVVFDLSGHRDWAERVAAILGGARVENRPDNSRYLDVAVVLGSGWRAPAQPFNP